jgi:hypothetical protein
VEQQIEVVILRCRECRRRRPAEIATAIGRLVRGTDGRWQAERFKHSPVSLRPWKLDESPADDERFGLVGDDGRLWSLSLVPVLVEGNGRTITVSCRGQCGRAPFPVRYAREGERSVAQGLSDAYV